MAKALFDNTAESPEELAFRKGDILMVLEQEQSGGPGWWLCSLHGRQGIAPANRLRLLQTAPPPGPAAEDSVYLSPGSPMARMAICGSAEDVDGVYRSPPPAGESRGVGVASRPGELRKVEGGRPRSHSSSGTRPRPDWDIGVAGRPRSPSLRGRGTDVTGSLYQSPVSPIPSGAKNARQPAALVASESVYLSPTGALRSADRPEDNTYLVPRETLMTEISEDCYLVPKGTPLASDEVYQSPTGGVVGNSLCSNGSSIIGGAAKVHQDMPGMYQTPSPMGTNLPRTQATALAHQHPSQILPVQASSRPLHRGVAPVVAVARGKPNLACHRGSPLLVRAGQIRVPGSPNFTRKPPPPAPPVRGVTRKEAQQAAPLLADLDSAPKPTAQVAPAVPNQEPDKQNRTPCKEDGSKEQSRKGDPQDHLELLDDQVGFSSYGYTANIWSFSHKSKSNVFPNWQVYDTPPSGRWQRPAPSSLADEDIYDTPRSVPPQADSESEVNKLPVQTGRPFIFSARGRGEFFFFFLLVILIKAIVAG